MGDHDVMGDDVRFRVRFAVDDAALSRLHARAFHGAVGAVVPWADRLNRYSLTWVGAFDGADVVGFVHAVWDGGEHAFLLDTAVEPTHQGRGIGRELVGRLVTEVRAAGCGWLHVDHERHLDGFYRRCGFTPTSAGLIRLPPS